MRTIKGGPTGHPVFQSTRYVRKLIQGSPVSDPTRARYTAPITRPRRVISAAVRHARRWIRVRNSASSAKTPTGLIVVAAAASVAAVRQRPERAQRSATKRQVQNGASLPPSTQVPIQSHDRMSGERTAGAPYKRRRHAHVI